jgi:hypothetical protein
MDICLFASHTQGSVPSISIHLIEGRLAIRILVCMLAVGIPTLKLSASQGEVATQVRKVHKVTILKNEASKIIVNDKEIVEGMTLLKMVNAIGHAPDRITFSKDTLYAHYTCIGDCSALIIAFSNNGTVVLILPLRD